jgi:hypothetical protein
MKNIKDAFSEATVAVSYPKSVLRRVWANHSAEFELSGCSCRLWFNSKGRICYRVPEEAEQVDVLIGEVERSLAQTSNLGLDIDELRNLIAQYMLMRLAIELDLRQLPNSQRRLVASNLRPVDPGKLPDEHQCLLEVLQEQTENAIAAAEKDGLPKDGIPVTISRVMVRAKLEEKKQQKK